MPLPQCALPWPALSICPFIEHNAVVNGPLNVPAVFHLYVVTCPKRYSGSCISPNCHVVCPIVPIAILPRSSDCFCHPSTAAAAAGSRQQLQHFMSVEPQGSGGGGNRAAAGISKSFSVDQAPPPRNFNNS